MFSPHRLTDANQVVFLCVINLGIFENELSPDRCFLVAWKLLSKCYSSSYRTHGPSTYMSSPSLFYSILLLSFSILSCPKETAQSIVSVTYVHVPRACSNSGKRQYSECKENIDEWREALAPSPQELVVPAPLLILVEKGQNLNSAPTHQQNEDRLEQCLWPQNLLVGFYMW